jgi:hypothetical protein
VSLQGFWFQGNRHGIAYTEKSPASRKETGHSEVDEMPVQAQVKGCESGNTRTRPSLQIVKSPGSPAGLPTTTAARCGGVTACGTPVHPQSEEPPATEINSIRRFDMVVNKVSVSPEGLAMYECADAAQLSGNAPVGDVSSKELKD